jgi:hypothetical protein
MNISKEKFFPRLIRKADYFGVEPKFNIDKKDKYNTPLGGIITIVIFLIILAGFGLFANELTARQNPTVISSTLYQMNPDEYVLDNSFAFFIGIQNKRAQYYLDPTIVKLTIEYITYTREFEGDTIKWVRRGRFLRMEPCELVTHFSNFTDLFSNLPLPTLYCVNPEDGKNMSLAGAWGEQKLNMIKMEVRPCKNSTESETETVCKPQKEIEETLSGGYFVINHVDTLFEPKNYTHPSKHFRRNYFTSMSNKYFKEVSINFHNVEYNTDHGILTEEIKTDKYLQLDELREYYDFRSDSTEVMLTCLLRMSNMKYQFNRKYLKIQDVVAQVGGLANAMFLIVNLMYSNFSLAGYYLYLGEKLFELNNEEKIDEMSLVNKVFLHSKKNPNPNNNSGLYNESSQFTPVYDFNKNLKIARAFTEKTQKAQTNSCFENFRIGACYCFISENSKNKKSKLFYKLTDHIKRQSDFQKLLTNTEQFDLMKEILFTDEQRNIYQLYTNKIDLERNMDGEKLNIEKISKSYEILKSTKQNDIGEKLKILFENKFS